MTRDEAVALIHRSELGERRETIIKELRSSVLIDATRVPQEELPIGASRIGGVPDLPKAVKWPRWSGSRLGPGFPLHRIDFPEKGLHFIAQLNLKDLISFSTCKDLPPKGILYFFYDYDIQPWGYDPADHLGSRVIYVEDDAVSLSRYENQKLDVEFRSFPCTVSFSRNWTIPDIRHLGAESEEEWEEAWESIEELKRDLNGISEEQPFRAVHRLFGWPDVVQGDMRLECQLVANGTYCGSTYPDPIPEAMKEGAQDWQLLLQIDTDEKNPGWMWGDCGRIYYWIHKDDLRDRRFENVRLILQCS